ncbi:hypothetical protein UFOVP296_23 [uncultured Caudovirales phage]|uniref:Uncharacterized protein n=1 Tax=uncultured Caudovirales phage TaxID=2100421 RepID=A0A6J5LPR1_9CAUD|nr:hypothetical protein UFOVP296_23 [uncultured Caudovirales phage]CAB4170137.1 hypothetical protein UFOVP912_42 [uncultured Caudovirales phage]CAB4199309.1 hypothetical protein UFOVP1334_30 [uncultured Caudovirales phage]
MMEFICISLGLLYLFAKRMERKAIQREQDIQFAERLIQAASIRAANNFPRTLGETKPETETK